MKKEKDILDKVKFWWKSQGSNYHNDFINGIKNLIYWLPVIWKDRDWDQHYIYNVLKTKLKKQAKYIGTRDFHTRAKRDAEIMLLCVRLIDKVQEEFYQMEYSDYNESEIKFIDYIPKEGEEDRGLKEIKINEISEKYDEYFKKYPLVYKKVIALEKPVFDNSCKQHIAMNMARYNQKRASDLLWKIVNNNIDCWWD